MTDIDESKTDDADQTQETPMTDGMKDKAREALVKAIPVGRIGEPEDIWLAVKFIIECEYFNARTIDVDGGLAF